MTGSSLNGIMNNLPQQKHTISSYHLKQHELVNFLYERFTVGMVFTLIVSVVATLLVTVELSLQGLQYLGFIWFAGILIIQYFRYRLKNTYDQIKSVDYLSHERWKKRFIIGVCIIAVWQGGGAVLVLPLISNNLQLIFHIFLLGLGAGAIAYLATSMLIFGCYLVLMRCQQRISSPNRVRTPPILKAGN